GLTGAHSTEFDKKNENPVIALISEWVTSSGSTETRNEDSDLGGTMRLGAQACILDKDSKTFACYQSEEITERHRHRYEFNNDYREMLSAAGLKLAGNSGDGMLVEVIEVPDHPWFVGCQFHPEFTSTPRDGHPLFTGFIKAAIAKHEELNGPGSADKLVNHSAGNTQDSAEDNAATPTSQEIA
ncbi:MAG: CTP synthase, partial [Pseudohongiellaceae bacterium]